MKIPDTSQMVGLNSDKGLDIYRRRLVELAKEKGVSLEGLSEQIGRKGGYLRDYVSKGSPKKLDGDDRRALAEKLGVEESVLGELSTTSQPVAGTNVPRIAGTALRSHVIDETPSYVARRDLPLRTYAQGGSGGHFFETPVGMIYRPEELLNVQESYAIEIWDTSMEPALRHGRRAYVNPYKQAHPEDEVVVQLKDGRVLVKELVRKTAKEVVLKQHNPPKELIFKPSEVQFMHLILSSARVRTA